MPWKTSRPPSDSRGYGSEHRRVRASYIADLQSAGVGRCCLGGELIYPEQTGLPRTHPRALVLDHTPDRQGYRGLACREHNARDGAVRGRARQTVTARRM